MEYILRRIHSIFRVRIEKIQILDPDIVEWGVRCDPHTLIIPTPGDWEWLMAHGSWLIRSCSTGTGKKYSTRNRSM